MHRFLNIRMVIVLVITIISIFVFSYLVRSCSKDQLILAKVSNVVVAPYEAISFSDSTRGANEWLWEFGNGDTYHMQKGKYSFTEEGKYQIRLTVNRKAEKYFKIEVKSKEDGKNESPLINIIAPNVALQNELIVFKGDGNAEKWRWEFGESGRVDAREKKTLYAFKQPGLYSVLLSTETTKYPIRHQIEIVAQYQENDSTDALSVIGEDIKTNLQAIVNGRSFNTHYNKVLKRYLCGNANTIVVTNNNKFNDFYSYCQGLKIIGRSNKTIIENVIVDLDEVNTSCISQLTIIQYDLAKR
ncbi:PKD domain-containing protein [Saccharicrinis aurantiacus]|uniref:PKD domain-containing protein n=1 Tax=Saccharicrinis aurantiacus TaxID=1849719 RepID=UPI002490BAC7|nr:PKD domain-containing protein [Saccharicrinis aurantiacus]